MTRRPGFPASLGPVPGVASQRAGNAPSEVGRSGLGRGRGEPASNMVRPQGLGLDSGAVRARMVQRLQAQGLADPLVVQAMHAVERHHFVDSALANQAYEDTSLPIGLNQTISSPSVVGRMIELLRGDSEARLGRVLEIGTGCGYQAAVLSHCATEVYSMERLKGLHEKARDNLRPLRLANLHLIFGDGMEGYPKGAPYAGIIAAACGDSVPQAWLDQLADGGRLVAPVTTASHAQSLVLIEKKGGSLRRKLLDRVLFVPLKSGLA